jgi:hypothetical protein
MVLFSVFMNRLYKRYSKQIKILVLFTGLGVTIALLGIDLLLSICLVFVFYYILINIPVIIEQKRYLSSIFFCLTSVITVYILTYLIVTVEFQVNYPDLTELHAFLICLGAANILVDIIYNNNKVSYYTNIKRNIDRY